MAEDGELRARIEDALREDIDGSTLHGAVIEALWAHYSREKASGFEHTTRTIFLRAALLREAAAALSRAEAGREEKDRKYGIMLGQQGFEVYAALRELVALKDAKDAGFKTFVEDEAYRAAKPKAWERARHALGLSSTAKGKD